MLLLLLGLVVAIATAMAATAAAAHHAANGLVTDFATGTESHSCDYGTHDTAAAETTHHAASRSRSRCGSRGLTLGRRP